VKKKAAQLLGITFRSFRYRLKKSGLGDPEESKLDRKPKVPKAKAASPKKRLKTTK